MSANWWDLPEGYGWRVNLNLKEGEFCFCHNKVTGETSMLHLLLDRLYGPMTREKWEWFIRHATRHGRVKPPGPKPAAKGVKVKLEEF